MVDQSGAQHSQPNSEQFRRVIPTSGLPIGLTADFTETALLFNVSFCPNFLPILPFPSLLQELMPRSQVNLLHTDLHLRVCILGNPTHSSWYQKYPQTRDGVLELAH